MKLYGTTTSPFVRRVRIVGALVGAEMELVNTAVESGQNELRALTPIWKVPVLESSDHVLFDSHVIIDYLLRRYGNRNVRTESGDARWRERNLESVIDGALDSSINLFYLRELPAESAPYLQKQRDRVESAMNWLEKQLRGVWFSDEPRLGLTEIALYTALDWMRFRDVYPVERHPAFAKFLQTHRDVPAIAATPPKVTA